MNSERHQCAWCGTEIEAKSHQNPLCPECSKLYETEAHRSLHPMEERHPHND